MSSEILAYYEIRLINENDDCIINLDDEITIKIKMSDNHVGSDCVNIV